jgi:hypothetical protein
MADEQVTQAERTAVLTGDPDAQITQVERTTVTLGSPALQNTQTQRTTVTVGSPRLRVTQMWRTVILKVPSGVSAFGGEAAQFLGQIQEMGGGGTTDNSMGAV